MKIMNYHLHDLTVFSSRHHIMDLYYVLGTLYMKLNILHVLEVFIDKGIQFEIL